MTASTLQTRTSRFNRYWTCPFCAWRAHVSLKAHFQTGQPLSKEQQIATLTHEASRHFRERHKNDYARGGV
jgi:transcription elongation factor Elf1